MKKITILSAALALTMSLTGCYDLDRYPTDKLSSGTYFKTEDHAKSAMMGVYSRMQADHVFGLKFSMDVLGGIAMGYDNQSFQKFARGTYDMADTWVNYRWTNLYESVARANIVIRNVDNCNMSDQLKAQYKAEARFMRALFYNELLNYFGGVPLYDETTDVTTDYSEMKKPRSSADDVRKFIINDLNEAYNVLPQSWESADYGRATKYAARALMGKIYLYNKQYTEAKECFKDVIEHGGYELYNDYAGLFLPGGDESKEMIFAIQNMGGVGTDYGMPMRFYMNGAMNNRADTPINFPLIRYADVLLMMAECEWALNNDAVAIDYINQVRQRPSVEMPALTWQGEDSPVNVKTHDEVFTRLRHERAIELAAEGQSFDDMKRWGLLETLNGKPKKEITGSIRYTHGVSSRDYLWPIPSGEREKNPELTQNPGWGEN